MKLCHRCGESALYCNCRRPTINGDLEDEADCLRDWRRDAAAEAALALPGAEKPTGVETISPAEPEAASG